MNPDTDIEAPERCILCGTAGSYVEKDSMGPDVRRVWYANCRCVVNIANLSTALATARAQAAAAQEAMRAVQEAEGVISLILTNWPQNEDGGLHGNPPLPIGVKGCRYWLKKHQSLLTEPALTSTPSSPQGTGGERVETVPTEKRHCSICEKNITRGQHSICTGPPCGEGNAVVCPATWNDLKPIAPTERVEGKE